MKSLLLLLSLCAILASCGEDSSFRPEGPIGGESIIGDNSNDLSEIVFTLDLIYDDSLYLVADSLFSLEIYLNNREWGKFTSTPVDTSTFETQNINGSLISKTAVQYLFITRDDSSLDSLKTAGDYSIALREILSIPAGDYVAEIRYVSWLNTDGQEVRRAVRDLIPFTLAEGVNSLYIGNFTSNIKL